VRPLESVPNFSEGRDRATIDALGAALGGRARLLDVHADPDHNRSVFTLVGSEAELVESLVAGIAVARERIDLRGHEGAHPRVGAADVVPLVPLVPEEMERAQAAALTLAERVGRELGLPVFLYGELAPGRGPAFFRRGGVEELSRRVDTGEVAPDFGPGRLDERAGAVLVGARGFPGVRALGLELPRAGLVQVSMNVEDYEVVALHEIVERVRDESAARGAEVVGSELVGLIPAAAALAAAGAMLGIEGFDSRHVLELRFLEE
jgi:glutamate formiminotransferase